MSIEFANRGGLRHLTADEIETVSGGDGNGASEIIVTAQFFGLPGTISGVPIGTFGFGSIAPGFSSGTFSLDNSVNFDLNFEIEGVVEKILDQVDDSLAKVVDTSALPNPTVAEKAAITQLRTEIRMLDTKIVQLSDNAVVEFDGRSVTGAEVKAIWAKTDFVINPQGTLYSNQTTNGQANFNGGNPVASFNVDIVSGFNDFQNGLKFLILHEFAHFLPPAQSLLQSTGGGSQLEGFTNDLGRTLGNILDTPTFFPGFGPNPGFTIPSVVPSIAPSQIPPFIPMAPINLQ